LGNTAVRQAMIRKQLDVKPSEFINWMWFKTRKLRGDDNIIG
jgi:hypothetical protein